MTRKREHRMTVRLNGDEYTKVLSKIERSGLSKQEYILSSILNKKIQERLNVDYLETQSGLPYLDRVLTDQNP